MTEIRVGVLGAASILRDALITPAAAVPGIKVAAVAARDVARAEAAALHHRIPHVRHSYEDLLADPRINAVYIPLPAALHAQWTHAAIDAGKHVLCEKPFTSNVSIRPGGRRPRQHFFRGRHGGVSLPSPPAVRAAAGDHRVW